MDTSIAAYVDVAVAPAPQRACGEFPAINLII
jgi:hypothetical protein